MFSLVPQLLSQSRNTASSRDWAALSKMNTRQGGPGLFRFWTVSKQLTIHGSHHLPMSLASLGKAGRDLSAEHQFTLPTPQGYRFGEQTTPQPCEEEGKPLVFILPHCPCYLCTPLSLTAPTNIQNQRYLMWETLLFIVWLYQSAHSQSLEPNQGQLLSVANLQARKEHYVLVA